MLAGKTTILAPDRFDSRRFEYADLAAGVQYGLQSEGQVYATVDVAGIPRNRPAPSAGKLRINRAYYNMDGSLWKGGSLREGQSLIAELRIESGDNVPDALVVDLLPAGLEIENPRLQTTARKDAMERREKSEEPPFVDEREEVRDDRLVLLGRITAAGAGRFIYLARAVTPGTFAVPPVRAECMYDLGTSSLSGGGETLKVESAEPKRVAKR